VHYDHIGSPSTFPNAKYIVGAGSLNAMQEGSPNFDASIFEPDLFDNHEVLELPPTSLDYFGDGSL
jgi:hypothetical protein